MSGTPPESPEVEEGSPFGGAECDDSSPEPAQQVLADHDQGDENYFPFVTVSVELYEGPEDDANAKDSEQNKEITNNTAPMSPEVENIETTPDLYLHMDDEDARDDVSDSTGPGTNTDSVNNSYVYVTTVIKSEPPVPNYQNLQKTYIEDFPYILPNESEELRLLAGSQKNPTKYRVDNKAAERSRLYREKHREEINQRRRDIRQRKKNSQQIQTLSDIQKMNEIAQATSNNQLRSYLHKQRQQRYYERHKEEINKRKRDSRLKQNISPPISASAAERNRLYRQRHREEINRRRRDTRQRKKYSQQIQTLSDIQKINEIDQNTHSTSNNQLSSNSYKQRQQQYHERHKEEINKHKRDSRL